MLNAERWAADQRGDLAELPAECRQMIEEAKASGDFAAPAFQGVGDSLLPATSLRMQEWPECLNRTIASLNLVL